MSFTLQFAGLRNPFLVIPPWFGYNHEYLNTRGPGR